jgi:Vam6/Vps39-like protein vacuolar protein sorting-associated protein 39
MRMPIWHWRSAASYIPFTCLLMHPKIFTSEEVELPPQHVANFLESVNRELCVRYLEFLIEERHEESNIYHDRLAELCLKMTVNAKKAGDEGISQLK